MFARHVRPLRSLRRPLTVAVVALNLVACRFDPDAPGAKTGGTGGTNGGAELGPTLQTSDGVRYLAHEVIVKVAAGMAAGALHDALARVGGHEIVEAGPGAMAALGYRRVQLPESVTADEAISELTGTSGIAKAERSYLVQAYATTPNDPRYGELWGMAKIAAPAAWDTSTGANEILVAVSDTGIDYTHPDLVANAWTNPGEIAGNGKDDDGNGYVDDLHGWDFANNDADPMDDHGHGTHCSGTIGGAGNNAVGVAGVNWRVKIQGVKFLGSSGGGSLWNGAQTVLYAAKMKARVVSASWGCLGPSCYASYMEDALKTYAAAGGLFVAAAGNSANDNDAYPNYPSNYTVDNVVAVAATDSADKLASFSDWGATTVDLGAPGVGILSTLPGNSYASWSGTSMATPHVAGAAALFLAVRPTATYLEVKQKLLETTDPVAALAGKSVSGGRLNLQKLIAAAGQPPATPSGFDATAGDRSDALLSWAPNGEPDLAGYRVKWGTASGVYTQTRDLTTAETSTRVIDLLHGTSYYFVVYARGATGLTSAASVEKRVLAQDRVAPPQVVDLAVGALPGAAAAGEIEEASGAFSAYWAAARAFDGAADTAWISPGRPETDQEYLTARLYTPYLIDAVDLLPNPSYPAFFPVDFDVDVSADGETWTTVGGLRNAAPAAAQTVRIAFPPVLASLVRLRVLRAFRHESGLAYASLAEMTVQEASSAPDSLRVTFSAPGDDPGAGRAQSYDLRRATAPLTDATFAAAARVTTGAPLPAGAPEALTVSGLTDETTYYFAMKATDEAGNLSPLSNVAGASTLVIPPSTITDLAVVDAPGGSAPGTVRLAWTAPGADGIVGQAASYDLRVSAAPLTAGGFAAADGVNGLPAPQAAGARESFAVTGLAAGRTYYFAVRAADGKGAVGGVSNVVAAVPGSGSDHTPPATVKELAVRLSNAGVKLTARIDSVSDELSAQRAAANLIDGDVATAWVSQAGAPAAPAWVVFDYGAVQPLVRFRTNPSTLDLVGSYPQDFELQTSVDKLVWTPLVHVEGLTGTFASWNEWPAPVTFARYVRLYVSKRGPAAGAAVFAAMGELEAYALAPSLDADLTWVAPGDDGYDGTAARYDLRQSAAPIADDASFAAATPLATSAPLHGGFIEVRHLTALPVETTLYFALRAFDSDGNASAISNVASLVTPGVAPAPVADLAVTGAATTSMTLGFTASGDDGAAGRATAYELRYAKTPLAPATWAAATLVPVSPPQAAGAREAVTVAGLEPSTVYYFAIKVIDDAGNASPMSNLASGSTADGIPPARVTDLSATPVDPTQRPAVAMTVVDSSGSYTAQTPAANLLDGNAATSWVSPGATQAGSSMYVTFDLGGARRLGRLRLRAGTGYSDLFPADFKLEVQASAGGAWKTLVADSAVTTSGGWEEWLLGAAPAVTARLTITKLVTWSGKLYTALGDVELYEDPADYGTLRLAWTAPGNDGASGTAASYDVRRDGQPITDATFPGATPVAGAPAPHPAGYLERLDATGLAAETTYCFALRATDAAGNVSPASSSSCATTPGMPPGTVTDLAVTSVTPTSATLTFTAPGGDGAAGTAAQYELRRSSARITTANWSAATVVGGLAAPRAGGSAETVTVTGLSGASTYHFAIRATDGAGNVAALSNDARGTTADDIAPSRVTDLVASRVLSAGGSLLLTWTAPGDSGMAGQAQRYDVRASTSPITDAASFAAATPVSVPAPKAAGSAESAIVAGLGAETQYYLALVAVDAAGNAGAMSNVASAFTREEAPSAIADLAVVSGTGTGLYQSTLVVQWTAPGDDGNAGTAARYEVRWSAATITAANFAFAQIAAGAPAPAAAGTRQQHTITGLAPGARYYVAMVTADERNNLSGLSNVASGTTPDQMAPAGVVDLGATTGAAAGTLVVSLTAPGDDGSSGTAAGYDLRWSPSPIDATSFAAATALTTPAPTAAGTRQTFTVTGLPGETVVYLALKARDDAGNLSALSNVTSARTPDVAPAAIADLAVTSGTGPGIGQSTLAVQWTAPGDNGSSGTAASYDVRWSTTAITAATFAAAQPAAGAPAPAAAGTRQQHTVAGLAPGTRYYIAIVTTDGRGNKSGLSNVASGTTPDQMAPAAVTDLSASTGTANGTLTVALTAPGDDGATGTAQAYDLRWGLNPLDAASFATAQALTTPAPAAAGTRQTFTVTGLPSETVVYLALKTRDDASNWSALSNAATASTPDVAPGAVADLRQLSAGPGVLSLGWTAPGDDGNTGTAMAYDLRYVQGGPITAATFAAATPVTTGAPGAAGAAQSAVVTGLPANKTYSFALKTRDERGNWSALSNVLPVATEDTLAPAAVTDLAATAGAAAGSIVLRWTAPGDDDTTGTARTYELRRSATAITAGNWSAATVVTLAAAPRAAGSAETATITGLTGETTYHFAIRAADEAGNTAPVSNDAAAATAPVAPAAVSNLAAALVVSGTAASATLTWTAPGDDGATGTASAYDLRYATAPITAATFAAATSLSIAVPRIAGSAETATATGLREATTYYFALKTVDDTGTWSALSNVASIVVPDLTKPGAPAALSAGTPDTTGDKLAIASVTASSSLGPSWQAANAADGDPSSAWSSAGSDTGAAAETLTLDLGAAAVSIDQIDLTPDARYLDLFPRDFTIAVTADGTTWKTLVTESGFAVTSPGALEWGFPPEPAKQVRVTATATGISFGKHYAIVAGADVWGASATDGRAQLTWIAPGDDGQTGTATRYQVYQSTAAFTEAEVVAGALNPIAGAPSPLAAGLLQTMLVPSLAGETTYFWGVRAVDEAGNAGALSAVVTAKTNDVPPAPVRTLAARATSTTDIALDWKATGGDAATGTAASVELRYLAGALHARNFASATLVPGVPAPAAAGTSQSVVVHGLTPGVSYHFALVAKDAAGNASPLSNVAVAATTALPDTAAPAAVADVTVALPPAGGQLVAARAVTASSEQVPGFAAANLTDGDRNSFWASAARAASQAEWARVEVPAETAAGRVRVWPADSYADLFPPDFQVRVSRDGLAWTTVKTVTGYVAVPGQPVIVDLPSPTVLRYVEFRATQLPSRNPGVYFAATGEIEVFGATDASGAVVVSWTAPTDDGPAGRPASYDLRAGACPFDGAVAASFTAPAPSAAGSPERARIAGLPSGTACVAVRSTDAAGNVSAWSNVATMVVP